MSYFLHIIRPYVCPNCKGDGVVEHIGEDITEPCEHCSGTGRWETVLSEYAPSQIQIFFNKALNEG